MANLYGMPIAVVVVHCCPVCDRFTSQSTCLQCAHSMEELENMPPHIIVAAGPDHVCPTHTHRFAVVKTLPGWLDLFNSTIFAALA